MKPSDKSAALAEREACAKIADDIEKSETGRDELAAGIRMAAALIADLIRARQ